MKIGIIGAGVSGLVSAKYCLEENYDITVFEQTGNFGGVWRYTSQVGFDDYGLPVHSAMYKNLMTNLPKEIMILNGLEHKECNRSFVSQPYVLDYIERYVEKFNILPHITFHSYVIKVKPIENNKWSITIYDAKTKRNETSEFDAVMISNGHYFKPKYPKINGMDSFQGESIHSHDFRDPIVFENKTVMIVGAGPSGVDITKHVATAAKTVYLSHKPNIFGRIPILPNVLPKARIKEITAHSCRLTDDTYLEIDTIIYCTVPGIFQAYARASIRMASADLGISHASASVQRILCRHKLLPYKFIIGYEYYYPFFTKEVGITVEDNWVKYVYRHIINIEHPTMALVGIPFGLSVFPGIDFMVRYFLAHLSGRFELPDKMVMHQNAMDEQNMRISEGLPARYAHKFNNGERIFGEMAQEANITPIPKVIFNIHRYLQKTRRTTDNFKVLNDTNFELLS